MKRIVSLLLTLTLVFSLSLATTVQAADRVYGKTTYTYKLKKSKKKNTHKITDQHAKHDYTKWSILKNSKKKIATASITTKNGDPVITVNAKKKGTTKLTIQGSKTVYKYDGVVYSTKKAATKARKGDFIYWVDTDAYGGDDYWIPSTDENGESSDNVDISEIQSGDMFTDDYGNLYCYFPEDEIFKTDINGEQRLYVMYNGQQQILEEAEYWDDELGENVTEYYFETEDGDTIYIFSDLSLVVADDSGETGIDAGWMVFDYDAAETDFNAKHPITKVTQKTAKKNITVKITK